MRRFSLLFLLGLGLVAGSADAQAERAAHPDALSAGDAQPTNFRARTLAGDPITLDTRPTLLMFFASWCHSCQDVLPQLPALAARDDLDVLVLSHERRSRIQSHGGAREVRFGQCTGRTALSWAARSVPTFVVVTEGRVLFFGRGANAFQGARDAVLAAVSAAVTPESSPR